MTMQPEIKRRATAEHLATKQREISVSEFFSKNRHLLGFDNPAKSLLTAIKEAVDNSLDACEEAGILPDITVEVTETNTGRFIVSVQDNGPGIVREQIPKIFAKLLYGSKFHHLKQSRGQQGIGISAAGLYAQLTTGKPIIVTSRTAKDKPAIRISLRIDTKSNKPEIINESTIDWSLDHGTRVDMELVGTYRGGHASIDAYLEQTVVANPHLSLTYKLPKSNDWVTFQRTTKKLPKEPIEIKPHPNGVELGVFLRILQDSQGLTVKKALLSNFSKVTPAIAEQVCVAARVPSIFQASKLIGTAAEGLYNEFVKAKVSPPSDACISPIGEDLIIAGMKRRFPAEFFVAVTRAPSVYRGNPFTIECGIAYGGKLPSEEQATIIRFANRVPLQYQVKACVITEAIYDTNWKSYDLQQPKGSLPVGPIAIVIHLASVWVPFTNEAKEAIAQYPELLKEIKLTIQDAGRRLSTYIRARYRLQNELKRKSIFERYIPELASSLAAITGQDKASIEADFFSALPKFVKVNIGES